MTLRNLLWCAIISALCSACGSEPPVVSRNLPGESESWYGVFIGEQRAGYLRTVTSRTAEGGLRLYVEHVVSAKTLDQPVDLRLVEILETTSDLKPKTYFQNIDGGEGKSFQVRGESKGSVFSLEMRSAGRVVWTKSLDLSGNLTFPQIADHLIRTKNLAAGQRWTYQVINPADFLPIRIEMKVDDITNITDSRSNRAFRVTARMGAVEVHSYIDSGQEDPYRIEVPSMGMVCVKEDSRMATASVENDRRIDLAYFAAVIPTGGTPPVSSTDSIRIRLTDVDFEGLHLEGDYQTVVRKTGREILLQIQTPDLSSITDTSYPEPPVGHDPSASAKLVDLTKHLLRASPLKFSRSAVDWMQANIRQVPTSIVPSASDVLDLGQGDCNEFSALFHALAREAGFSSKIVSGVVYLSGRYFYHSWNEIQVGSRWVPVDPILDEIPASAKHIKLIEGDFSASWRLAGVIRRLRIEILPN